MLCCARGLNLTLSVLFRARAFTCHAINEIPRRISQEELEVKQMQAALAVRFATKDFLPHFEAIKTPCLSLVYNLFYLCSFCTLLCCTCVMKCEMLCSRVQWTLVVDASVWKIGKLLIRRSISLELRPLSWFEMRPPRDCCRLPVETTLDLDLLKTNSNSMSSKTNIDKLSQAFPSFTKTQMSSNVWRSLIKFFCYVNSFD